MINVAIIDDNYREIEPIFEIIKSDIANYSCKYFDGTNPEEINAWVKTQLNPVVMLDLFFNGDELGENIFAGIKKASKTIPVFIFTSITDLRTEQKYKDLGCYDYIVKNRVQKKDAQILLERIRRACEAGSRFNEAFERCRKLWLSDQRGAILSLNDLLNSEGQQNLMALYELHDWIKGYLKKDLEELSIGLPIALSMLEQNCSKIEAIQKDIPIDIILDKILSQIHLGKRTEASASLKEIVGLITHASQGKRFLGSLATLCSDDLSPERMIGIIDMSPATDGYESILEWMYHYNKVLWNEAVTAYFSFWQKTENTNSERIIALFDDDLYAQIKEADLFKYHSAGVIKFIFDMFAAEIKRVQEQETVDLSCLYNCSRLLFEGAPLDSALPSDRDEVCDTLNSFAGLLYLKGEPAQWIDFVDNKIAKIGSTRENVINDVLTRPGREPEQKRSLLYQIIRNLLNSNMKELAIKILNEQEHIICDLTSDKVFGQTRVNSLGGVQLYRFGELLSEAREYEVASRYMSHSVEGLFTDLSRPELQKQKNDILLYIQQALKKLKEMGVDIASYEEEYKKLSSENIRLLLPLDGKRCAIAGGHLDIGKNLDTLKERLGGDFIYYGTNVTDIKRMVNSIRSGGVDMVIYITGYSGHDVGFTFLDELTEYNKRQLNKVELIQLPTTVKNISGIINELKTRMAKE